MSNSPGQKDDQIKSTTLEAVYNPDILDTVFAHFESAQPEGRNALYRFSLVCRSFKGPALHKLWVTLGSISPLLDLLPHAKDVNGSLDFCGQLAESPFLQYANHVRELFLVPIGNRTSTFSGQVFSGLAKELNGSPLLPNLCCMTIFAVDDVLTPLLPLLFHPGLHTLNFEPQMTYSTPLHHLVFRSLQEYSSVLKKLAITLKDPFPPFSDVIFNTVIGLKHLKHLEICAPSTPFNPTDLARLGVSCPELATLDLDVCFDHAHLSRCPAAPKVPEEAFANLAFLHLTVRQNATYHIDSFPAIVLCGSWPEALLTKLTALTVFVPDTFCWCDRLVEPLSQLKHFRTLKYTHTPALNGTSFYSPEIVNVLSIPSLVEAVWDVSSIHTNSPNETSELLEQLVKAAFKAASRPKGLRTLVLPIGMTHPFSLKALEYISKNAIGLESLSICIDSSMTPDEPIGAVTSIIDSPLLRLRVCDQRESSTFRPVDYRYLAKYIDTIFPNLESLGVYKDSRGDGGFHGEHWNHIDHLRRKERLVHSLSK